MNSLVKCAICDRLTKRITNSHLKNHGLDFKQYRNKFPNIETASSRSREKQRRAMTGKKLSEEAKKKLSIAHKGKIIEEETRKKLSQALKGRRKSKEAIAKLKNYYRIHGHHSKGRKHTSEAKRKISEAGMGRVGSNKGKKLPEEVKKKISQKLKGIKLKLETRKKMSLAHKGKILSEITKKRISNSKKGVPKTPEHIANGLKSINRSPNKFEQKCIKLFKEQNLPLKFVGGFNDKNFFIGGRVPDFVTTNNKRVLVEVFYDYYKIRQYGSVENYKRDRTEAFARSGWKTLFFSYEELDSGPMLCVESLRRELG